jgi:hypothetical protein
VTAVITRFATAITVTSPVFPGIAPRLLDCNIVVGILRRGTIYSTLFNVLTGCFSPSVAHPNGEAWCKKRHAPDNKPALSYLEMGLAGIVILAVLISTLSNAVFVLHPPVRHVLRQCSYTGTLKGTQEPRG